jgi:hypothetical protein
MSYAACLTPWEKIAESRAGVISMRSAIDAGLTSKQIRSLLSSGQWQSPMRDVFVTSPGAVTRTQLLWCALESVGRDAVLGGATAAELDGLRGYEQAAIMVLVASERRIAPRPGVTIRHTARLDPVDVHAGKLPRRTRPARSVVDMAEWALGRDAAQAVLAAAVQQRLVTVDELRATLRRRGPITRRSLVADTLDEIDAGAGAVAELLYRRVEQGCGLPAGQRQHTLAAGNHLEHLEMLYEQWGVCVVIGRDADPARQRWDALALPGADRPGGYIVVRCGIEELRDLPGQVGTTVADALHRNGWPGPPADGDQLGHGIYAEADHSS